MKGTPRRLRRSVLPVRNPRGTIGTATVVADGLAVTALHVVAPEQTDQLRLGAGPGVPVRQAGTVPLRGYRDACEQASLSDWRASQLVGREGGDGLGTVDLALLAVPGLRAPALRPRAGPARVGERLIVPSYPGGSWVLAQGPVTGADDADFAVRLLLGPGASGAPVLDEELDIVGVVTLDHDTATICVGPTLLSTFLRLALA